jgi:hypothetical protein
MKTFWRLIVIAIAGVCVPGEVAAAPCPNDDGPRAAVDNYITAMSEYRFSDAYDYVSTNMTDGKSRDDWAGEQSTWYKGGEVAIFGKDIRKAHATEDDAACETRATVPNVLKSRDKFNTQGTTEFEYYITVKDGGAWKVDSQETLFDDADIKKWFPDDEVPEFRSGY